MSRRKVTIVSAIQIIDNPRVVKEADALCELGLDVEVLAAVHSAEALERIDSLLAGRNWLHTPVIDWTRRDLASSMRNSIMRASTRLWREARRLDFESHHQLGVTTTALARAALASRADLYSLHLEAALWTGNLLVDRGLPFRIDIEDWYSEDGLPADRATRPINLMKRLEGELLNRAVHATTTSQALAEALAEEYGCRVPDVVYNSFPSEEREAADGEMRDRRSSSIPSVTWFSQTIGPGRGLETLIEATSLLEYPFELHLRGTPRPGYAEHLLAPLDSDKRQRVLLHPQVPQSELLSRLMEHDIGYCGERSDCRNRDLTITNKQLEYMRAGLAIVASDTAGQKEFAKKAPGIVSIFGQGDPRALAAALRPLFVAPQRLREIKGLSWRDFDAHFGWERSKRVIQSQVSGFFEGTGARAQKLDHIAPMDGHARDTVRW
jgi:glycosyltransferase involved in cell wall biosynthesis